MNMIVTAWLLIFTPSLNDPAISVQAIANYEACMQLGKDMKGSKRASYYGCYDYPMVVTQQASVK